jgi:hypothetical protein
MRIEMLKPTNGDFYPNFFQDMVKVYLMDLTSGEWRVAVWGNDDYGLEFDFANEIDAKNMFYELALLECINAEILKQKGFTLA